MKHSQLLSFCIGLFMITPAVAQERAADVLNDRTLDLKRPDHRAKAFDRIRAAEKQRIAKAQARGRAMGWPLKEALPDGGERILIDLDAKGFPVYLETRNANAAITTAANQVWTAPYNLDGSGLIVGVWESSIGRTTHREFATGSRLVNIEGSDTSSSHGMHVAGIIAAAGVDSAAHGMANAAKVYMLNSGWDKSGMIQYGATAPGQTATKLYTSNHSYGPGDGWSGGWAGSTWTGTGTDQNAYDDGFGQYSDRARDVDSVIYNAPYLASFWACGNDRTHSPATGTSVIINGVTVNYDPAIHPPGDGVYRGGYDTINADSIGKNVIAVGNIGDAVKAGVRDTSSSVAWMYPSSCWGPADDGRIKPDLVANGAELWSTLLDADDAYGSKTGTSMASPNACGSATLLVDQYKRLFGSAMRASTLKALLIHAADDLGRPGPDYCNGWGLVNVKIAADIIASHAAYPTAQQINEGSVSATIASPRSYSFVWDGSSPISATMAWTDPAASMVTTHDSRTPTLVNNLNLKLIAPDGTEYFPYVMPFVGTWTTASMSQNATTGINNVDNVEQVRIANPGQAGVWTAQVSYTGTITNGSQDFGLIISGLVQQPGGILIQSSNGGDNWVRGTTQNITWSSSMGGNVKIELLKNGVLNSIITSNTFNDGSHSWTIPTGQTLGSNYRIRITSVETPSVSHQSATDFTISAPPAYYASMDTNPGWTFDTGWAYGVPTGANQDGQGNVDPTSGQNGANVIGYKLDGDYEASLTSTRWAKTPAINCVGYQNVKLSFYRWLGVEKYDRVYIEASNNGTTWTPIWSNPSNASIYDSGWTYYEYDISTVADGRSTVYIRWGLGNTDSTRNFSGWNLDEVKVDGVPATSNKAIITASAGSTSVAEGGSTDSYTVTLSSAPTANVTINILPDSQVSTSPTSLAFTTANWSTPQTVTVTAVDDALHELAHTGTINHSATSTDANYNSIAIDGILINITDNDNTTPSSSAGADQSVYLGQGARVPGLWYGTVSGTNIDLTTPNPRTSLITNVAANTENSIAGNTTEIYTGYIYDADGKISFTENIDDNTRIKIDGALVLSSDTWNDRVSTANLNLTPGWHAIEIRIWNGSGGSGPASGIGIGFDPAGGTAWQTLVDPGNGSLLHVDGSPTAIALLDATASDTDGDPLSAMWTLVSGPGSVTFGNASAVDTTATFSAAGTYTLSLSVSDSYASASDDVVITVTATSGYAVSYSGNNATGGTPPASQAKSVGVNLTLATNSGNLAKTGYAFAGWNTAADGTGTDYAAGATYSTDAGLALYAKWTLNISYTVTFDTQDGTGGTNSVLATYGSAMPAATAPTRTGYTFCGYYTAINGGGNQYYTSSMTSAINWNIAASTTLYAKWTNSSTISSAAKHFIRGEAENATTQPLGYYTAPVSATVGTSGGTGARDDRNAVFGFTLPTLPAGATLESATFNFEIASARDSTGGGNLPELHAYLVNAVDPTGSGAGFFYHGALDPSANAKHIGTTSVTISGTNQVDFTAGQEVRSFTLTGEALTLLKSYYSGNTPTRSTAYFRFNMSADPAVTSLRRYNVNTADTGSSLQLVYTAPVVSYTSWSNGTFPGGRTLTDTASTANPDGDGLVNLMEFALGMDPTNPVTGSLVYAINGDVTRVGAPIVEYFAASGQSAKFHAVFARRKNYLAAGLTYTVEFSADLSRWTAGAAPTLRAGAASSGDVDVVEVPFPESVPLNPSGSAAPKFFRLKVTSN